LIDAGMKFVALGYERDNRNHQLADKGLRRTPEACLNLEKKNPFSHFSFLP